MKSKIILGLALLGVVLVAGCSQPTLPMLPTPNNNTQNTTNYCNTTVVGRIFDSPTLVEYDCNLPTGEHTRCIYGLSQGGINCWFVNETLNTNSTK